MLLSFHVMLFNIVILYSKDVEQRLTGPPDTQAASHPAALWESGMWALVKQEVTDHIPCGKLDQESITQRFCFDDKEILLYDLNLSPAKWTPDINSQTHTHTPVACTGYFTLTILGKSSTWEADVHGSCIYQCT